MATIGGVTAAGVALDMLVSRATGRWKGTGDEKTENNEGEES
jgi:hypothetical protein